ncbi:TetR/AcrR family transcriptional regulator [Mycolicibacterium nivoides]|jgi:AcrR family transcriptional regulator|uniref:TetR/AcrR family transcriptional regulator n=2 Tax=Actinomycetes TaxID=1760 RepID=A0ABW9L942_9MYCO|nr:TetR/AcrR family transcriptional regulator [Mycolicibacterium septicum]QRY48188.1 TetR/AcrR family transcriptional regulator [Mycolicibacterium boenickei]SEP86929.1 DNA-binding transcriptional regulator, AcrR family [Mycobacterium sp. 88mf]SFF20845.1 DNA-binding transcriptional regulator, AcrR family [Mycobacterium sp. 455mf]
MATTRGRPRSFDRDEVLDKVIRMFWQNGYEATSMRDLTEEVGIAAPSLYNTFGDKQHLFAEAVEVYDREYGGFIDAALAEETTARRAAARVFAEAPARYTRRGLPSGCLIVSGDAGTTDPVVQKSMRIVREHKIAQFADKIRADIAAGALPSSTDPDALARYVMAVLSGIAQQARDGASRVKLDRLAAVAAGLWP